MTTSGRSRCTQWPAPSTTSRSASGSWSGGVPGGVDGDAGVPAAVHDQDGHVDGGQSIGVDGAQPAGQHLIALPLVPGGEVGGRGRLGQRGEQFRGARRGSASTFPRNDARSRGLRTLTRVRAFRRPLCTLAHVRAW